jgi:predicted AAA+ superfamily ATPase
LNPGYREKEIIAIRGPRQSEKTTLLKRIREKLLAKKINNETYT